MLDWVVTCLALNVYHEARGEPVEGQVAVALATINRAKASKCEVCDVVFQPTQFSWTKDWKKQRPPKGPEWDRAWEVAIASLTMKDYTLGANHFHEEKVRPDWAKAAKYLGQWGSHKFYYRETPTQCKRVMSAPAD